MSKNQLKPSINPEEYDYEEYSYRQNSLSAFYRDDEDERDYDLETAVLQECRLCLDYKENWKSLLSGLKLSAPAKGFICFTFECPCFFSSCLM